MKLDRQAWLPAAVGSLPATAALLAGKRRTALALTILPVALAAFFRDPVRLADLTPPHPDVVLSPADGKVMYAGPVQPELRPDSAGNDWSQVSIFLSVFDVHINRTPYSGNVVNRTYRPGRWHAAYRFASATENERTELHVVDDAYEPAREVIFRQIVGLVARRVVTRVEVGDRLKTGQRIGLMKFGSRMDVFLPPAAPLCVTVGQRVVAGQTPIGRFTP